MLTLCIDTAYKYLTVALLKEDGILEAISFECFKRQSEEVFVALNELFKKAGVKKSDIDSVCISSGPGSYTGVRIAMTIAKVLCQIRKIELYRISTLCLYAGNRENTMVVMDARAKRAYVGIYDRGRCIMSDRAMELDRIKPEDCEVVLDGELVGRDNVIPDIPACFLATRDIWEKVEEINYLAPEYLKESDAYYR
ncbi:MAG: tRNA (adenosine(37)-N6)-threonylcarbamoyltransferase complex dimerization subunit type 1 TsaB [Erysipelotrichaceae bacterium]|nr:tRNA (adenosine(37)-N6)-threonylcarbamoyltransferase complex dimerization subunit type 1 TsaB [Erysipelotrichaceae bacterium]